MREILRLVVLRTLSVIVIANIATSSIAAETLVVTLISAHDGDTCRVRDQDGNQHRIRLFGIDAPEADQPYGQDSGEVLRELLGEDEFEVDLTGEVTYGRKVGRIYVADLYVNKKMIADGWAWHYRTYTRGNEREEFDGLESEAKEARSGLWADSNPIRPSCWRAGDRDGDCQPDPIPPSASLADGRNDVRSSSGLRMSPAMAATRSSRSFPMTPVDRFRVFQGMAGGEAPVRFRADAGSATRLLHTDTAAHTIYGKPVAADDRFRFTPSGQAESTEGITELKRTAFTVGHYDRYRLPAWVAMRWSKDDYERGIGVSMSRPRERVDTELPEYARGGTSFEYSRTGLQRGHMAPDDLMESWGEEAVEEAVRMSNFVPQLEGRNHAVWTLLEVAVKEVVANDEDDFEIDRLWTVAGPVFYEDVDPKYVGRPGTRVPDATYKIVAWKRSDGELTARAYVIKQLEDEVDLWEHLVTIDEVEDLTGLDFFAELRDSEERRLESTQFTAMWE